MIPNVFHFVFGLREQREPFHLMYYLCLASCIDVNRPDAVYFHYHHEPWGEWWERIKPRLILERLEPEQALAQYRYADASIAPYRYAHLADLARLRILSERGGIYADIDTLFIRPVPAHWRERQFILGQEKAPQAAADGGSLCNAWIASAPGAEFGRLWLAGFHDRHLTAPGAIIRHCCPSGSGRSIRRCFASSRKALSTRWTGRRAA